MFERVDVCLSESVGLWVMQTWGFMCYAPRYTEVGKLGTCILWAIVRAKDSRDAMLWKHLLQQGDNLAGIGLARWNTSNKDHLQVEVTHYQVVNSFKHENICGTHLPWVWWCGCRCEGCCSILTLELCAGFTLADYFFNGLVNAGPEETSMCEQLLLCYSLMELMQLMLDSLTFSRRNDECFTSQDKTVLDGEGLSVLPVWTEGMRDFLDVLGPASNDEVSESSHFWVTDEGLLESFLVGWWYAGMVDSNIQWNIGAWLETESR